MPGMIGRVLQEKRGRMGWKVVTLEEIQNRKYSNNDWDYMTASGSFHNTKRKD